ncbi:MAG: hypothetical protein FWG92_01675 [Leptospirales bacterium]|nr:hypothetical protein [Leptospirales bacterium]
MKVFLKILFLLLVALSGYTAFTSYNPVREGMSVIVIEESSGNAVYAATEGQRFILYKAFGWKYSVETVPLRDFLTRNIRIDIPALKDLKDDTFAVIIPLKADFSVNLPELYDLNLLKNAAEGVKKSIENELRAALNFLIGDYLSPVYRDDIIRRERETILTHLKESVSAEFAGKGIVISDLKYTSPVSLPDDKRYEEGVLHLGTLRRVFIENDKKLEELKGQLERNAMSMESLHNKYREMSLIIKENPDILKYIYIDKMAPNLKLIISSDKSALPAFLDENETKEQKTAAKKNIETETTPKNESINAE